MVCTYCGGETTVSNSRLKKKLNNVWRRRECLDCGAVFTTSESTDFFRSLSVTDGKHLQPFSRDKLFISIHDSVRHRKTATSDATGLTDTVISKLRPLIAAGCIQKQDIIKTSELVLRRFDRVAAVHYTAYYS